MANHIRTVVIVSLILAACVVGISSGLARFVQDFEHQSTHTNAVAAISVTINLPKRQFSVGTPIPVRVLVSNTGNVPIIVANNIGLARNTDARMRFSLTDRYGTPSPYMELIADDLSPKTGSSAAQNLFKRWMLLYPGYSILTNVEIDKQIFAFLGKPGNYVLAGRYFSGGTTPSALHDLGFTESDMSSFECWRGNVPTNEVKLEVTP